mmetsp:Transcript_44332/g.88598  ORF Transcript_44332/g.88598 Transcript_44332/m.88598 type:complete len:105 (-) Transcript_44332:599-913(-)
MGKPLRKPKAAKSASSKSSAHGRLSMAVAMGLVSILAGGAAIYWTRNSVDLPTAPVEAVGIGLDPGMRAPSFEGTIHTGETLTSEQLHGHRVLLWFYPRASTGG